MKDELEKNSNKISKACRCNLGNTCVYLNGTYSLKFNSKDIIFKELNKKFKN